MMVMPYAHVDGMPTMLDSEIMNCFELMQRDKTADVVFYDGLIKTPYDFIAFVKSQGRNFFITYGDKKDKLACGWIDTIKHRTANAHFSFFSGAFGKNAFAVGKHTVVSVMSIYGLEMLIGLIPSFNRRAIKVCVRYGAVILGEMPCGSIDKNGESLPTTVLYYVR